MKKDQSLVLIVTVLLLTVIPLSRFVSISGLPFPVPGWTTLFIVVVAWLSTHTLLEMPKLLRRVLVLLAAILFAAWWLSPSQGPANTIALLQTLSLIGFFTVGWQLRRQHGRFFLAFLLIGVLSIHAVWGITQFVHQSDIGFSWLGETNLVAEAPGVAKFRGANNTKLLRAYGPYPHPNSFAGSLLVGAIILTAIIAKRRSSNILLIVGAVMLLGIILTFSRSVWLGTALLVLWWLANLRPRGALLRWNCVVPLLLIVGVLSPLMVIRSNDPEDLASRDRLTGIYRASDLLREQLWWRGVGVGGYERALAEYVRIHDVKLESWEIAPVHTVPLLLAVELGLLPALIFAGSIGLLLVKLLGKNIWYLTPLLPPFLLDHYLWTQVAPAAWLILLVVLLVPPPRWEELSSMPSAARPARQ